MVYAAVGCLGISALSDLINEVLYPFVQSSVGYIVNAYLIN